MDQNNKDNSGIDLSGALKGSDNHIGVKHEYRPKRDYASKTFKIIQWVIKYSNGLVKNEEQANYVLVGFVAVAIIVSLFLVLGVSEQKLPSEREIFRDTPATPINP